ncbi:hypothetical protein Y032_0792g2373, partial [Ancylostoma ceylanicum]
MFIFMFSHGSKEGDGTVEPNADPDPALDAVVSHEMASTDPGPASASSDQSSSIQQSLGSENLLGTDPEMQSHCITPDPASTDDTESAMDATSCAASSSSVPLQQGSSDVHSEARPKASSTRSAEVVNFDPGAPCSSRQADPVPPARCDPGDAPNILPPPPQP